MSDANSIGSFISTYGFPTFVAVWLLLRIEPRLHGLSNDLKELERKIGGLTTEVSRMLEALRVRLGGG